MKIRNLLSLCAATAICQMAPAASFAKPARVTPNYVAKSEGYAIWLPGRPQIGIKKANMPGVGAVTVHYAALRAAGVAYAVVPMRIPKDTSQSDAAGVLAGIEEGFRASGGGKVLSSKNIRLDRNPGREVVITMGAGPKAPRMRGRFFVATGRTYQIMAITPAPPNAQTQAQIQRVLDSFRILG